MDAMEVYKRIPFPEDTPREEFFLYKDVPELMSLEASEVTTAFKCRTIGALYTENGRYYLSCLDKPKNWQQSIRLSLVYIEQSPTVLVPYPAQVFGQLQWANGPVIWATVIQPLTPSTALRLRETQNTIKKLLLDS